MDIWKFVQENVFLIAIALVGSLRFTAIRSRPHD